MTSRDFIFWLKGYLENAEDSKQKLDIEKALNEVEIDKESNISTTSWGTGGSIKMSATNTTSYVVGNNSTYDTTLKSLSKINGFYVKNNLDKSN